MNSIIFDKSLNIVFGVTLIAVMGVPTIAPAFPEIASALEISMQETGLLITVFTFPGIFLAPLLGFMSDRYGRKRILVPSLFLFGVAGTACAFTKSFEGLLILRFFQGLGAAPIGALNLTVIGDLFDGRDRRDAMGYNSMVLSIAAALYPLFGGILAEIGWFYPFLLSASAVPIGFIVLLKLKNPEPHINYSLKQYLQTTFRQIIFPRVLILYFSGLATFVLIFGILLAYFPFYMEDKFNSSSVEIGIVLSIASVATAFAAVNLSRLTDRFGFRALLGSSFLIYTGAILIAWFSQSIILVTLAVLLFGFANGINIPNAQTEISHSATIESRGALMSVNSMMLRIGQTIGPLVGGLFFSMNGFDGVFIASVVFTLISCFIIFGGLAIFKE